jgi:Uncharacterized conserved protein
MAKEIGISIYPEHSTQAEIIAYLNLAAKYNVKKVFSCLLSVNKPIAEIKAEFTAINNHATALGMELLLDVSPRVFDQLGISYNDLSFFHEIGATGIRLDEDFGGAKEAQMTYNKFGLDIELNMSNDNFLVDNVMVYQPNVDNLIACHNFYPMRYAGLSFDHFIKCSERFKKYNLKTSAFVSSPTAKIGPWPVMEGLCTLEMHRDLPIQTQAKHLFATGLIDVVIIGNMFASEEELKALSEIDPYKLEFQIELIDTATEMDETVIFYDEHFQRPDINDYMVRSTMTRVIYRDRDFPVNVTKKLQKGDIIIGNDDFGQYKGELNLIKNDLPLDKRKNYVGKIIDEEIFLMDYLKPATKFRFVKK